jgi:hypothetical protein
MLFEFKDGAIGIFAKANDAVVGEADGEDSLSVSVVVDVPFELGTEAAEPIRDAVLIGHLIEEPTVL